MPNYTSRKSPRHSKVVLSSFDINYLRVLNPFMPLWWGLALPGLGHIMVGKKFKGFLLFIFEIVVNSKTHLNLSIFYSCTGQFELAKACLDLRWFFIYIGVYIFSSWDAYRLSTDINQFSMLATREKAPIRTMKISPIEINYLQKINPWLPAFWSFVTPGIGHLIIRNVISGLYLLGWYIVTVYKSKLLEGIYYTSMGEFHQAISVMNIEWTLYLPSVLCFAVCDSYYHTIEINELFKQDQARFLEKNFFRDENKHYFLKSLEKV
ncbi:MAG TPA: hypothetical protein VLK78_01610 [Candidatus Angelobacter sp.]|nr:hypothetical protein [Candidatus Angelobacter sp.]